MHKLQILEKYLNNNDTDKVIGILDQISSNLEYSAIPLLIKYLSKTENNIIRNHLALTLSDLESIEAMNVIINLLKDPKTKGSRGTLLFSLKPFDCSAYFDIFIEIILKDNYESRNEAYNLLKSNYKKLSNEDTISCVKDISRNIEELEDRIELLYMTKELLNDKK